MALEKELILRTRVENASSVKELKEAIKECRDNLVQLDKTSEEYKHTVDSIIEGETKLTEVMKAGKTQIDAQEGSYNALVNTMKVLQKEWRAATTEADRARLGARISEINSQLKEMDASIGNFQRNVGDYENAFKRALLTPQQELRKLRQELAQLTIGTDEYNRVFQRMSELTIQITKQQELLRYSSSDLGAMLSTLSGIAAGVAGGFSAVNAAIGLMGGEDSDVQNAMLKVQRFMAIVQGLKALEGLSEKLRGFWTALRNADLSIKGNTQAATKYNESLDALKGTATQVTAEIVTEGAAISSAGAAAESSAAKTNNLKNANDELRVSLEKLKLERDQEILQIKELGEAEEVTKGRIEETLEAYRRRHSEIVRNAKSSSAATGKLADAEGKLNKKIVETNNIFKLYGQRLRDAKAGTDAVTKSTIVYTAATPKAARATEILAGAINLLKLAIGAVAIGLLIAGISKLIEMFWKWASGANKAERETNALAASTERLNAALENHSDEVDFQVRMMEAQGKGYKEIYEYTKAQKNEELALAKATLRDSEAMAKAIGQRKLGKKRYQEFNEKMQEQRDIVQGLEKDIKNLDRQFLIDQEREKHQTNFGGSFDDTAKDAAKLYKTLLDYYKTDRDKLYENYIINKGIIEKGIKDQELRNRALILLEMKFYADLKALRDANRREMESTFIGQEKRRLALKSVYDKDYVEEARKVAREELDANLAAAAKRVGFEKKTDEEISRMDAQTKKEYLDRQKLFNNERLLLEREWQKQDDKIVADGRRREIKAQRAVLEANLENAKSQEDILDAKIKLAEFDAYDGMIKEETESQEEYTVRVIQATKALEALYEQRKKMGNGDQTQLRLDNDAEDARINNGDRSMQYMNARLKAAKYYQDHLLKTEEETAEEFRTRQLEALADVRDAEKEILNQRIENWSNLAIGIGNIMGSVADIYQTDIENMKDANGNYTAEAKKKFEQMKGLQIAQATINTIAGAIAAFMGCQELGQPWGMALGAVQAAAVTAAGFAEIAKIKAQKLDSNGGGSSSSSTRYATAVPVLTDYVPQGTVNITGGQEVEDLKNALANTKIVVSVTDINEVQSKVRARVEENTF